MTPAIKIDVNNPDMSKALSDEMRFGARIKVVGVGGSGGNAIDHMINSGVSGVDFIAVNCDVQDLHHNKAKGKIHIGKNLTRGLGAGMNPEIGKRGAEETKSEIQDALRGADLVFITCGLGGGTGTGAAPIIAEIAKNQGSLTVAVVTKPFSFEGAQRTRLAEEGLERLMGAVDTVIVISNDRLLEISDKKTTFKNAFALCDDVLKNAVQGISELILKPGIINVDFADIRTIMAEAGPAIMGIGESSGDTRAVEAAKKAISSPLLDISIDGAKGVLFVVAGGDDMTLSEINDAAKIVTESVDPEAKIIFGAIHDETVPKGAIKITVIAAGFMNPSSNVIVESPKTTGIRHEEKKNDEVKSKDDFGDIDIPAFLRREKERVPPKQKLSEEDHKRKPEHLSRVSIAPLIGNISVVTALEIASPAPHESKLSPVGSLVIIRKPASIISLENYKNHGHNKSTRSNGLRDFNEEGNFQRNTRMIYYETFRTLVIKFFMTTSSILKKIIEISFIIILGAIAMIVMGIYKAGSIIRNWFQGMIY